MQSLAPLDVLVILRRLAAVEPAVVTHHAHAAMAQRLDAVDLSWCPETAGLGVRPGHQQRHLAGIVDARPYIMLGDRAVRQMEAEMRRHQTGLRRAVARRDLGEGDELGLAYLGLVKAALQDRRFPRRIGIGGDVADAQMVIPKDLEASLGLHDMVLALGAPAHDGLFIAPRRMRQHPTWPQLALETLVVDEAIDGLQDRPQMLG